MKPSFAEAANNQFKITKKKKNYQLRFSYVNSESYVLRACDCFNEIDI